MCIRDSYIYFTEETGSLGNFIYTGKVPQSIENIFYIARLVSPALVRRYAGMKRSQLRQERGCGGCNTILEALCIKRFSPDLCIQKEHVLSLLLHWWLPDLLSIILAVERYCSRPVTFCWIVFSPLVPVSIVISSFRRSAWREPAKLVAQNKNVFETLCGTFHV